MVRLISQALTSPASPSFLPPAAPPPLAGVVRLISQAQDAERLGHIVWARDPEREQTWWPAEALDPWNLPPGVTITAQQVGSGCCGLQGEQPEEVKHCKRQIAAPLEPASRCGHHSAAGEEQWVV